MENVSKRFRFKSDDDSKKQDDESLEEHHDKEYDDDDSVDRAFFGEKKMTWSQYFRFGELFSKFHAFIFPGLPEHYPLRKKIYMAKSTTYFGTIWDISQVVLSLIACGLYIAESYDSSFYMVRIYGMVEIVVTQLFLIDFLINWFVSVV